MGELRSPLRRSFDRALLALFVTGMLFVTLLVALLSSAETLEIARIIFPSALIAYLVAGMLAWYYRPSNRMGPLILLAGVAIFLTGAENTSVQFFVALGVIGGTLTLAVFIHLLLAFPSGLVQGKIARATVAMAYLAALVLQAPRYLFKAHPSMPNSPLWDLPRLAEFAASAHTFTGGLVLIVTVVLLALRLRLASTVERRVLLPLYAYGIFAVAVIFLATRLFGAVLQWSNEAVGVLQLAVVAVVPAAFALAVLRGGVARTGELEELGAWLGAAGDEKPAIASALARTLGDPSIAVWFWVPNRSMYVDVQGVEVVRALPDDQRGLQVVELEGRRIGAISYDRALMPDPELARTAGRVVAIALDRERLTAELRASRRALQDSRQRLVEAADLERRRIAQDLHDGLQVQLVLLALEAQQLAHVTVAEEGALLAERATALRLGIDGAAAELRELVHSVMPAALIQRGLSAAAEDLVDRMPIPTTLDLGVVDGDCPPVVESIAYFVVAEALSNAVKYSNASAISVRLHRTIDSLHIEVDDDGGGGARAGGGWGLLGMAERIDVLGGTLTVLSELGSGTTIRVEVPCA